MTAAGRRSRARWIAALFALAAIPVVVVGIRQGIRFALESRAIAALHSSQPEERELALQVRAIPGILGTLSREQRLDQGYPELTAKAMEALAMISRDDSIPLSIRALAHEERGVRDAAITALWTVGSAASRALPALRRLREEEKDFEVAERATTLVRRLEFEEGRPPEAQR